MTAQNYRQQQRAEATTRLWQQWASGAVSDEQPRAAHIAHGNSLGAYQHQDIGTRVNAVTSADFDQNFQPINENFPLATSGTYVVRTGDSLRSIAATVWGDAALWYLIAEANGMQGDEALTTDIRLTLPNVVTNIHNNANTHRPVDPGLTLGDTQPLLPEPPPPPPPKKKKGCGAIGTIIVVVVAIVVAWATAGWASGYVGNIAGWAIGGAAGSIASQGVGMAMGMQESFSWSSVATSAIAAGVTAGVGELAGGFTGASNPALKAFADPQSWVGAGMRATVSNVATQGISVATGLQRKFDWRGVAAASVGSAFGSAINGKMGNFADTIAGRTFAGMANGGLQSAITGQSPNWGAIAANSFGSSVGDGIGKSAYNTIQRNAATKSLANENEERLRQQQDPEFWRKSQDAVSADVHERMPGRVGVPMPEITQTQPSIDWSGLNGIDRSVAHQLEMAGIANAQAQKLGLREQAHQQFSENLSAAGNAHADAMISYRQSQDVRSRIEWDAQEAGFHHGVTFSEAEARYGAAVKSALEFKDTVERGVVTIAGAITALPALTAGAAGAATMARTGFQAGAREFAALSQEGLITYTLSRAPQINQLAGGALDMGVGDALGGAGLGGALTFGGAATVRYAGDAADAVRAAPNNLAAKVVVERGASGNYSATQFGAAVQANPIASRAYATLQNHGIDVSLYRAADGFAGTAAAEFGPVRINMAYNETVGDAVSTMIHEAKHVALKANTGNMYGLRSVRSGEYSARSLEFFFENDRRPTALERATIQREIIDLGY